MMPFLVIMTLVFVIFVFGAYSIQHYYLKQEIDTRLGKVPLFFEELLFNESKFMEAQLDFIAQNKRLIEAWNNGDRENLYQIAKPIFEKINKKYNVTHFYFINPDGRSLLRVHAPKRYGDIIKRRTFQKVKKSSGFPVYGIELGLFGTFTLRVILPWIVGGDIIGYLELGEEIEHLTPRIKMITDLDLILTIHKSNLKKENWEAGIKLLGKNDNWNDFEDFVVIDKTLPILNLSMREMILKGLNSNINNFSLQDQIYRFVQTPLKDFGGKVVGEFIIIYNITEKIANTRASIIRSTLISFGIVGLLFIFLYIYTGFLGDQLTDYQENLEELIKVRTSELQHAQAEVKILRGFFPICASCKKIKDDNGYWNQIETYIQNHSEAEFSHSICPECAQKLYPEIMKHKSDP